MYVEGREKTPEKPGYPHDRGDRERNVLDRKPGQVFVMLTLSCFQENRFPSDWGRD